MTHKAVTILLADDDYVDIMAVQRAFRNLQISNPLIEAHDGIEALQRLKGQNGYDRVPDPRLVLLDLNMPRMGGIEFLTELRKDAELCRTVVFVMSTSSLAEHRTAAYSRNVAGYILKGRFGTTFQDALTMLQHYCRVIEFPD